MDFVSVPSPSGELPLSVCRGSNPGPAVVIVPSIFGVAADLVEQMEDLAEHCGLVASFDPFFRARTGPMPYTETTAALAILRDADLESVATDVRAMLAWARGEAGRVIAVGICFGGPFCFRAAAAGLLDGVVTWHGSRLQAHVEDARSIRCPMRLHFGAVDPFVPAQAVEAVRVAFADHDDVEIVVHPGATHGFSHRTASAYEPTAERAAMRAVRELVELARRT